MSNLPDDWMTLRKFHDEYPGLHASLAALKWEVGQRRTNGLLKDAVVVERFGGAAHRASLLISPSRYFMWLGVRRSAVG